MTDERAQHLRRLRRVAATGAVAAFGALFGLAAHHAAGAHTQAPATATQPSSGFFSGGSGYGFGNAQSTPPAAQTNVS